MSVRQDLHVAGLRSQPRGANVSTVIGPCYRSSRILKPSFSTNPQVVISVDQFERIIQSAFQIIRGSSVGTCAFKLGAFVLRLLYLFIPFHHRILEGRLIVGDVVILVFTVRGE